MEVMQEVDRGVAMFYVSSDVSSLASSQSIFCGGSGVKAGKNYKHFNNRRSGCLCKYTMKICVQKYIPCFQ